MARTFGSREASRSQQVGPAQQPFALEDVALLQPELVGEHGAASGIEPFFDLQAHDGGQVALPESRLDEFEEVVGHVFVHIVDGVAGDAEDLAGQDLHAGKEQVEVVGHDALERHPHTRFVHLHETRNACAHGYLDPRQRSVLVVLVAQGDEQVERQIRDEGEGVGGVRRLGCHQRVDVAHVVLAQPLAVLPTQVLPGRDPDALGCQRAKYRGSGLPLPCLELAHHGVALLDLFAGSAAVNGALGDPRLGLLLQSADPLHEELVQVGSDDGEELQALQQRRARVLSLVQHAEVEVEPGQLAIQAQPHAGL